MFPVSTEVVDGTALLNSHADLISPVFERIHHGLFKPYLFKMSMAEAALQNIVDDHAQVFRGRDSCRKIRQSIQVLMIEAFENFAVHKAVQISQIANHAGALIDRTANRDFERVVVAVPVGIVALAVRRRIFCIRHGLAMQPMGSRKHVPPGQVGLHASP